MLENWNAVVYGGRGVGGAEARAFASKVSAVKRLRGRRAVPGAGLRPGPFVRSSGTHGRVAVRRRVTCGYIVD